MIILRGSWQRAVLTARRQCARLILALTLLLTTACTATVSGFTSPLSHDYGAVQWLPLTTTVQQGFITGPGYSDAVANDARTTPAQFQQRLAALPADAREGEMVELRVGVRLAAEGAEARGPWDSGARVQLVPLPEADLRFPEGQRAFHDWAETDVWLPAADEYRQSFVSPYGNLSGITVRVATFGGDLSPGEGTLGSNSVNVLALPVDGEPVASLAANSVVTVLGAAEGWARVELPDGATGFVPQEAFVQLPESERQVGDVNFSLRDASGTVVREALIPAESIRDNAHLSVLFDPLPESAGQSFTFRFGPADPTLGSFTLRATTEDAYAEGALIDDGATGDLIFRPVYAEQPPLFDLPIDALPRDDDWFIVEDPPDVPAGIAAGLRLVPGDREDAGRVHFGVTTERAPYGTTRATDTVGSSLPGALLMTTTWERDVDLRGITEDGFANLRGFASDDPVMTAVYITLLITMSAITVKLWPVMFPRRSRRD